MAYVITDQQTRKEQSHNVTLHHANKGPLMASSRGLNFQEYVEGRFWKQLQQDKVNWQWVYCSAALTHYKFGGRERGALILTYGT